MSAALSIKLDLVRLTEYDDDGFLGIQCDANGAASGVPAYEFVGQYGLLARPLDPDLGADGESVALGAELLTLVEGEEWRGMPLGDPRVVIQLPQLQKGETLVHGARYNFIRFHADGRISQMCTSDGTPNGKSLIAEQASDGWTWSAEWAVVRNTAMGWYYRHASGARFEVGSISGLPAPLDGIASYAKLVAGIIEIQGVGVKLGTGSFEPPAKALTLQAALTTVAQALAAIGPALTPPNPAAAAAIAAAVAAIAGLAATMPAQSVQVA